MPTLPLIGESHQLTRSTSYYPTKLDNSQQKKIGCDCRLKKSMQETTRREPKSKSLVPLRPNSVLENPLPRRERRLSDAGKPFTEAMPFSSVVDVIVFKKLYYPDWNREVSEKFDIEIPLESPQPRTFDEMCDALEENDYHPEREQKILIEKSKSKRKKLVKLSLEGQVAMMKCYDDVIRPAITSLYPKYGKDVHRTKTPAVPSSTTHLTSSLPLITSSASMTSPHLSDLRSHLRRAGSILDAVRTEKGQRFVGCVKKRPRSRELVESYNEWADKL